MTAIQNSDSDSMTFFANVEESFVKALQDGSLKYFLSRYRKAALELTRSPSKTQKNVQLSTISLHSAKRISLVTKSLINLMNVSKDLTQEAIEKTNCMLSTEMLTSAECLEKNDSPNSQLLRRWFLKHIDYPFPEPETKMKLADQTNAKLNELESRNELPKHGPSSATKPITKNQCQLWFINTRRRSTWTEFFREYAFSTQSIMTKLVKILNSESENGNGKAKALSKVLALGEDGCTETYSGEQLTERVKKCQDHWITIMEWLEQRPREPQSDWLSKTIEEATVEYNQARKVKREERRKIREIRSKDNYKSDSDEDYSFDHTPSRSRRIGKKRKSDESDLKPTKSIRRSRGNAQTNGRRPSTMMCSMDQYRNVSGSSTSSLDTTSTSISSSSYMTASSPLASYGMARSSLPRLQSKADGEGEMLYHQPCILSNDPPSQIQVMPASPLMLDEEEMGDEDGEFEEDNIAEEKQEADPWN